MRVLLLALLGCSCGHRQQSVGPPPPPFVMASDAGQCDPGIGPSSPDAICDGRYTVDGLACAVCPVNAGCLAAGIMVYCVTACTDRACAAGLTHK